MFVCHIKEMARVPLSKDSRHIWLNNQACYQNQVSGSANGCEITNDFFNPSNGQIYEKRPRYNETSV